MKLRLRTLAERDSGIRPRPLNAGIFFALIFSLGGMIPAWSQEDPWATMDTPQPKSPPQIRGPVWTPPIGTEEIGTASYYSDLFQGRPTASGVPFDQKLMTAAHKRLAFGTRIRVTNQDNGRSVDVIVNDRGPFITGRILDLSRSAASVIGLTDNGIAPVTLTVLDVPKDQQQDPQKNPDLTLPAPEPSATPDAVTGATRTYEDTPSQAANTVYFQVGAYKALSGAQARAQEMTNAGFDSAIYFYGDIYRVYATGKDNTPAANLQNRLEKAGFKSLKVKNPSGNAIK